MSGIAKTVGGWLGLGGGDAPPPPVTILQAPAALPAPPVPTPTPRLPTVDSEAVQRAREEALARQQAMRGRSSTILTTPQSRLGSGGAAGSGSDSYAAGKFG